MYSHLFKNDLSSGDLAVAGLATPQIGWRKRKPLQSIAEVQKANPYRGKGGLYTSKDKATSVTTMEQDMQRQSDWLHGQARALGHADADALAHQDMTKFFELAKKWRRTHAFKLEAVLGFKLF